MTNNKIDLCKALAKLGIDESQLVEIGIGLVEYDDNGDPFSKPKGPKLEDFLLTWEQLSYLEDSGDYVYVIYNKDSGYQSYEYLMASDIAKSNNIDYHSCKICNEYKLSLPINPSDYDDYYKDVFYDGGYVCFDCHKALLNGDVDRCRQCHSRLASHDGYCSNCY